MSLWNFLLAKPSGPARSRAADTIASDTARMRKAMREYDTAVLLTIDYEIRGGDGRLRNWGRHTYD